MSPSTKRCSSCQDQLVHNNISYLCQSCVSSKAFKLFMNGKTISEISKVLFNSIHGRYRGSISGLLKERMGSDDFLSIKSNNRNKAMSSLKIDLPFDFISRLCREGKTSPQIYQALLAQGYSLHIATLRSRLKKLGFDLKVNDALRKKRRQCVSKKRKKAIEKLWLEGNNMKDISHSLSLAEATVRTYLHQMGFKTKLPQNYVLKNYTKGEIIAKEYLEKQGYEVKKCFFICQRKSNIIVPKDLRPFCKFCPVQQLKFEHKEFYDFVVKMNDTYIVVEVKKTYVNKNWERAHFSLGQFINLPQVLKHRIPFKLLIIRENGIEEKNFSLGKDKEDRI